MQSSIVTLGTPSVPLEAIGIFSPPKYPPVPSLNTSAEAPQIVPSESNVYFHVKELLRPHFENLRQLINIPFTPGPNGIEFRAIDVRIIESLKTLPKISELAPLHSILDFFSDPKNVSTFSIFHVGAQFTPLKGYAFKNISSLLEDNPLSIYMVFRGRLEDLLSTTCLIDERPYLTPQKLCFSKGECFFPSTFGPLSTFIIREADGGIFTLNRRNTALSFDEVEIDSYTGPRQKEVAPLLKRSAFFVIEADIEAGAQFSSHDGFTLGNPPRLGYEVHGSPAALPPCKIFLAPLLSGEAPSTDEINRRIALNPQDISVKLGDFRERLLFEALKERESKIIRKLSFVHDANSSEEVESKRNVLRATDGTNSYQISLTLRHIDEVRIESSTLNTIFRKEGSGFFTVTFIEKDDNKNGSFPKPGWIPLADFIQTAEKAANEIYDSWKRASGGG